MQGVGLLLLLLKLLTASDRVERQLLILVLLLVMHELLGITLIVTLALVCHICKRNRRVTDCLTHNSGVAAGAVMLRLCI